MKITDNIYFYEGDYLNKKKKRYHDYYRGIGSSNFLILKGKDQILIDSGMHVGPHIQRLNRELMQDGVNLTETNKAVFSHTHPDHILYAKEIAKQKKIDFYIHEQNEERTVNSDYFFEYFFNFPRSIQREVFHGIPKWMLRLYLNYIGYDFRYLRIAYFFDNEIPIDFDIPIEPFRLAGHAKGHLGFHFPTEKVFYSADLFDSRTNPGASIGSSDSDLVAAIDDIQRVLKLDLDILLPGHGQVIRGKKEIRDFLTQLLENTKEYPRKIMQILPLNSDDAITLGKLTTEIYPDCIASNGYIRHIITYNCLKYLHRKNRVGRYFKGRMFYWYKTDDSRLKI